MRLMLSSQVTDTDETRSSGPKSLVHPVPAISATEMSIQVGRPGASGLNVRWVEGVTGVGGRATELEKHRTYDSPTLFFSTSYRALSAIAMSMKGCW